jgi:hypothetical protein
MRWLSVTILLLGATAAMAVEEAPYETVETFEAFELRRYAPVILAEVAVAAAFEEAGGKAFPVLAGFIGGKNEQGGKIAMTAPVEQAPASERIAMTAPVNQTAGAEPGRYVVSFVMPREYSLDTLPRPTDPRVRIRVQGERLVAARRYSGRWTESRYRDHEQALLSALAEAGFSATSAPVYARYNAPFVPWFLRRNEVLVEVRHPDCEDLAPHAPAP